jgi:hypothetical protein
MGVATYLLLRSAMSVPDMDANGNHPAGWLLFGLFPGETPSER